jgi:hypothetical protein
MAEHQVTSIWLCNSYSHDFQVALKCPRWSYYKFLTGVRNDPRQLQKSCPGKPLKLATPILVLHEGQQPARF